MKFSKPYTLKTIAELIAADYVGDENFEVLGANEIHVVEEGDIVFVDHPKYYDTALNSKASVILINKKVDCPEGKAILVSDDPFRDFNKLINFFKPFESASQTISESAQIHESSHLQPGVFIGNHVRIGKNCLIHPNVIIYDHTEIGDNVTIHAGAVIGADAFYYKSRPEGYDQLKSGGKVVIEDNVYIGAAATIDRGVTGETFIGKGTKIDNHVQIAHDTYIGQKCLIASQVGIAGCCIIEDEVTLWGQVGIASGMRIGKKAVLLAQSGVTKDLKGGLTYFGSPAEEARKKYKEMIYISKLPEIYKKLK